MKSAPNYLVGSLTIILGFGFLIGNEHHHIPTFFSLIFLVAICTTDTLKAKIPNYLTFTCIMTGLIFHSISSHLPGFLFSVSGFALGLGLFLVPFLMGGMGAGDVKALAALGALIGPGEIFNVFLLAGLIGGALSVVHYSLNRNFLRKLAEWWRALAAFILLRSIRSLLPTSTAEKLKFPYATAIALGYFAHLTWGSILQKIFASI